MNVGVNGCKYLFLDIVYNKFANCVRLVCLVFVVTISASSFQVVLRYFGLSLTSVILECRDSDLFLTFNTEMERILPVLTILTLLCA